LVINIQSIHDAQSEKHQVTLQNVGNYLPSNKTSHVNHWSLNLTQRQTTNVCAHYTQNIVCS